MGVTTWEHFPFDNQIFGCGTVYYEFSVEDSHGRFVVEEE
jgi:hypothetical protein